MADSVQAPPMQTAAPQTPPLNAEQPPKSKRGPLLPAFIILIGALLIVGAILIFAPQNQVPSKPSPSNTADQAVTKELEKGKILLAKKIAQVGKEILYGKDLSYYFYQINQSEFANASEQEVKNRILATLIEQSIVLQAAQNLNLVQLGNDVFNNLDKNYVKRITLFNQAYAALQEQESLYSGEVITIWYYNQRAPKIPIDQAQALAKQKLEALRAQIASGTITMTEAAERIRNDTSLSQLDGNYQANAYYSFTNKPLPETASMPQARSAVAKLQPGELSNVILIQDDVNEGSAVRQELYAVIKLTDKKTGKIEDFNAWLENEKKQYPVKVY